jgi:hypothetical protein
VSRPLNPPLCGNEEPYCRRGGMPMNCVKETNEEWVFQCWGCGQVNIVTRPEYRAQLRRQAMGINGIRKFF